MLTYMQICIYAYIYACIIPIHILLEEQGKKDYEITHFLLRIWSNTVLIKQYILGLSELRAIHILQTIPAL